MRALTGLDTSFLGLETETSHMTVAGVTVFDPSTASEEYSFLRVKQNVADRLHLIPPFRRRVAGSVAGLTRPVWVEDPDFDLSYHVRRAALPAPGGMAELRAFASEIMTRPLDRSRPLWEMWVVEGLEGGRVATITKIHHAAIDGVSGAELTVNLLDFEAQPGPAENAPDAWEPEPLPSLRDIVRGATIDAIRTPARALHGMRTVAVAGREIWRTNRSANETPPPAPFNAPKTRFNGCLTRERSVAFTSIPLNRIAVLKDHFGVKVNDVVLAITSGAMRRYLAERDELPSKSMTAMVPVDVRTPDERGAMDNKVGAMIVGLASDIDDPVRRLETIGSSSTRAKEQLRILGPRTFMDLFEVVPHGLINAGIRLLGSRTVNRLTPAPFNVVVSNIPASPIPLYSVGAEMLANFPLGPVLTGAGLNITVMSYCGSMDFGLQACPRSVPDLQDLADLLGAELRTLEEAAGIPAPPIPVARPWAPVEEPQPAFAT